MLYQKKEIKCWNRINESKICDKCIRKGAARRKVCYQSHQKPLYERLQRRRALKRKQAEQIRRESERKEALK